MNGTITNNHEGIEPRTAIAMLSDAKAGQFWRYDVEKYGYPKFSFEDVVYKTDANTYFSLIKCAKRHNRNDLETLVDEMVCEGFIVRQDAFASHGCAHIFDNGTVHIIRHASSHCVLTQCGRKFTTVPRLAISGDHGAVQRVKLCRSCFKGMSDEFLFLIHNIKLPKE